jgi:hypothetical protein
MEKVCSLHRRETRKEGSLEQEKRKNIETKI